MVVLTRKQKQILDFVQAYIQTHGYAPTLREIGKHFGLYCHRRSAQDAETMIL